MNSRFRINFSTIALSFALPALLFVCGFSTAPESHFHNETLGSKTFMATPESVWSQTWIEIYKSEPELIAQHQKEINKNIHYPKLISGSWYKHSIALTFDDGPHPDFTPRILAILKKYNIKATFFIVGAQAEKYPWLVSSEAFDGHVIGNHSFNHVNLTTIPTEKVYMEWRANNKILKDITGQEPRFSRPPGGDYNRAVIQAAQDEGLITVLWTDNSGDYDNPDIKSLEQKIMIRAYNGGIILMHDGEEQTIQLLPKLIEDLKARGFAFETIDDMARERKLI